jgi:integrase
MPEALTHLRQYTSKDFTALRAFVQRIPPATIARTYFDSDDDEFASTPAAMERYLREMHDTLVKLAIEHGSSVLADHLRASIKRHGSARLAAESLKMVEAAARLAVARPAPEHGIGMWFKPLIARRLKSLDLLTLRDLIEFCNRRGGAWWRSVPRVGAGRARRIVAWLRSHEASLGLRVASDVDLQDPLAAPADELVLLDGDPSVLVPLERMTLQHELSGIDGSNRASAFCYVAAKHDLEAVRAYLNRYRDQPKTLRAYTKELERFLLWCVCVRGKAMSSLLVDDCEAYKDFLQTPSPAFVGPKVGRHTPRWRPFASTSLSPDSQKYAVRALRATFSWLVDVRYLAGNPWTAIKDPIVIERQNDMKIDRALSAELWQRVRAYLDAQSLPADARRWRVIRALLLLMGDSGLRREEAAGAMREAMRPSRFGASDAPVWELTVIGKRHKERTVPASPATVEALRAHWIDRGRDFDAPLDSAPLLAPIVIPNTPQALKKHSRAIEQPYSPDSLNDLVAWAATRMALEIEGIDATDLAQLAQASPHAFRHTFGTQAAAQEVPLDVIQKALGHQSMQTTSIYVQAEQQRIMRSFGRYYARPDEGDTEKN